MKTFELNDFPVIAEHVRSLDVRNQFSEIEVRVSSLGHYQVDLSFDGERVADFVLQRINNTLNLTNLQEFRIMEISRMLETYATLKEIIQPKKSAKKSAKILSLQGQFYYILDDNTQLNVVEYHEDCNEATLKLEMTIETEEDGLIDLRTIKTSSNIKLSEFAETFAKLKARI